MPGYVPPRQPPPWLGYLSQALSGLGAGLLGGQNFGQGLGMGFQQANQNIALGKQQSRQDEQFAFEKQKMDAEQKKLLQTQQEAAAIKQAKEAFIASQPPEMQTQLRAADAAGALDTVIAQQMKPQGPESSIAKLGADLKAGLITPEQFNAAIRKETYIAPQQGPAPTETERLLRLGGIDPNSEEGRAIIRGKLAGSQGITMTTPDGSTVTIGGKAGDLKESQAKATQYYATASKANESLSKSEQTLTSLGGYVAGQAGVAGNFFKSPEYRQAEQDAVVFTEQYYRALTGAAAPEAEYKRMAQQIIPLPGDDAGTIAKKKLTREAWLESIKVAAGPGAAKLTPTTPAAPSGDNTQRLLELNTKGANRTAEENAELDKLLTEMGY